jgi:leucyl-tRNA synthetase
VSAPEPFQKLVNQGLILGEDGEKMSKSRGNVINPDEIVAEHGADAFRLYEMFMGPLEALKPWSTRSIEGADRFLNRLWRLVAAEEGVNPQLQDVPASEELTRLVHVTIKTVTQDIERLRLNTAIAAMMVLLNALTAAAPVPRAAVETILLLLSPFAPHVCEELWERLGHREGLTHAPWPRFDPAVLKRAELLLVVQVNGKVRARITVPAEASDEQVEAAALNHAQVKKAVDGHPIKQVIIVPNRLVSIVV